MFILQTINRAYNNADEIPWETAHEERFDTLAEARAAAKADLREMRRRCGPSAWDSHRRIIPTRDTSITYALLCRGHLGDGSHSWVTGHIECPNEAHETVVVPWPAGEPMPGCPVPDGWASTEQCAACRAAERAWEDAQLEKMEREHE